MSVRTGAGGELVLWWRSGENLNNISSGQDSNLGLTRFQARHNVSHTEKYAHDKYVQDSKYKKLETQRAGRKLHTDAK
jgi:hypothetical protein